MLRTLGGKNLGKCRLRAHQHPLLPPLPNLRRARPHAKQPRQDASSTRDERVLGMCWGCVLKIGCFLHRFLISGPDLRIDARISPFKHSCVHRFLISSPNLRIDAALSLSQIRTARLLRPSRQRPSASESNFRSCKEEWPASYGRRDNSLPRPILIFEAAKKNGPPAA